IRDRNVTGVQTCALPISTRLALPEVRLGIFPAWGGMMRLPHLIGPQRALSMMLTGRSIRARQAASWKLVDATVPRRIAKQAAAQLGRAACRARLDIPRRD